MFDRNSTNQERVEASVVQTAAEFPYNRIYNLYYLVMLYPDAYKQKLEAVGG
jgi:hypothetical protein